MDNIKKIANFLFELAGAKTTARTGWQRIGIKVPESLADHAGVSGQIAYVLALMEDADPDRAAALSLFHDTAELRLGDANWVARVYTDYENKKERAVADQLRDLPVGEQMKSVFDELKEMKTKEARVAQDADFLDMAIQSRYYSENGNQKAALWYESIDGYFSTKSAQDLYVLIGKAGMEEWWMEIDAIRKKFRK
ncbi:MAG: HD domain-containing protein [Candidatus Pacebacteria bacterium]|jgi:putative hydrolase of HD superfamily|nr:HD domain-containing protein [Candidatus Paceibacterota bacterium]